MKNEKNQKGNNEEPLEPMADFFAAGFLSVCEVFREGNTVMLLARKRNE